MATPDPTDPIPADRAPPALTLPALFLTFLRFGLLAFGGPVAQIAMIREALVERERWIDGPRFNRLLAVMQLLPGPEAHELCVHLGMRARGRIGGLLAGIGFMAPGLLLMLVCAWAYVRFVAGRADLAGLLLGVQAAVLAIILRAVHRIAGHVLTDQSLIAIAPVAALATLLGAPFWAILAAAGIAHMRGLGPAAATALVGTAALLGWLLVPAAAPLSSASVTAAGTAGVIALFVAGLKGGLLTFGGAYTAIPYVRADTVGRGWLSDGAFLDGVAVAGILPAPLVIFGTFVGYVAGGLAGALALTAGMFLPAFAFSLIFFERLERVVENVRLHRLLDGIAAAVVGIIAATFIQLAWAMLARAPDARAGWTIAAIFAVALLAAWRLRGALIAPALILFGGMTGWLLTAP